MRSDIFVDKKSVHFKLDKEVHLSLRAKLFKYNISMQELFDEFARMVVADMPKASSIVDSIVNRKIRSTLANGPSKRRSKKEVMTTDFEADALYDMINGTDEP